MYLLKMAKRLLLETDKRLLWKLAWNMGFKGMLSVERHKRRLQARRVLPAVPVRLHHQQLQPALPGLLGGRGRQAGDHQAGGLPQAGRARPRRWATSSSASSAASRSCTRTCSTCWPSTPIATSRSSPTASSSPTERAKRMRQLGNVTPLISVEGNEIVSDERRGRRRRAEQDHAGRPELPATNKVFTGVCTSLCQTNIDDLLDGEMGRSAHRHGRDVHLVPRLSADGAGRLPASCA